MADFHGMPVRSIAGEFLEVQVLAEAGPRIVRLVEKGSRANLLLEVPDIQWSTPHGIFHIYGGHRLWHAPEVPARTNVPDDSGLTVEDIEAGLRLIGATEKPTGIQKILEIRLAMDRPALTLRHILRNRGSWAVTLAPWGITVMPMGGVVILPQPEPLEGDEAYRPNRRFVFWPKTSVRDPRMVWGDRNCLVRALPDAEIFKIGYPNPAGWMGYWRGDRIFLKRYGYDPKAEYPDQGVNTEVYISDRILELETLGPMTEVPPGGDVAHMEEWEIRPAAALPPVVLTDPEALALAVEKLRAETRL